MGTDRALLAGRGLYSWDIKNEVAQLDSDQILLQEYYCRNNQAGAGIVSCDQAYAWVTRGQDGTLQEVYTPRINVSRQKLELFTVNSKYLQDIGRFGELMFAANYTNKRKHELQSDQTQPYLNLISDPTANWTYDAGPKWKADASVGWAISKWTTTLYANMLGATPNYLAYASGSMDYTNSAGAKAGKWGTYTTFNLGVDYQVEDNLRLSLQVNNIGNKLPDGQAYNYPGTSHPRRTTTICIASTVARCTLRCATTSAGKPRPGGMLSGGPRKGASLFVAGETMEKLQRQYATAVDALNRRAWTQARQLGEPVVAALA